MSEIAAAERRLSAALDRIDYLLERGGQATGAPTDAALAGRLDAAMAENEQLREEIALLHKSAASAAAPEVAADDAALAEMAARLTRAGEDAARLAAANDALAEANRALMASQGDTGEAAATALEAEIEALRAARAAEIGQMGDIVLELDRLLGRSIEGGN